MNNFLLKKKTDIKDSNYGILEPVASIVIEPTMVDVVFVPLLAFDISGHRVGYGKGFYDRFLARCRMDAIFVGLSFFEAESKIDSTSDDIPLDFCVTPEKIYCF